MKILEHFVCKEITPEELEELYWCCRRYQNLAPVCSVSCPARTHTSDGSRTPCTSCVWDRIQKETVPLDLQSYNNIYDLNFRDNALQMPDFEKFLKELENKLTVLSKKVIFALEKCGTSGYARRDKCPECSLFKVCNIRRR